MKSSNLTALARSMETLLRYAESQGVPREEFLTGIDFDQESLSDPEARLPLTLIHSVWVRLEEVLGDPVCGLNYGRSLPLEHLGLVGHIIKSSSTIEQALRDSFKYGPIYNAQTNVSLERKSDRLVVVGASDPEQIAIRHPLDARMALVASFGEKLTGRPLRFLSMTLQQEAREHRAAYENHFGCSVNFGAETMVLEIDRCSGERSIPNGNPALSRYLREYADGVLDKLPQASSFRERVVQILRSGLTTGSFALEDVASAMGMSSRSLQRSLAGENASFSEVLEEHREETALQLIRHKGLSIKEIASLLGYQEVSSFHRAFKRWTQLSPGAYRGSALGHG